MNTPISLTPEALAELRRLLDAANHARDVYEVNEDDSRGYSVETWDEWSIATCAGEQWAQLIAAAVNALPSLLDELDHLETDVAEAEGDAQRYWPFVERAERAEASLARVRGLHERESFWRYHRDQEYSYLTQQDAADESGCDCPYLAHTPECLATISHFDVCSECARIEYADAERQAHGEFSGYAEAIWPCPTIRALDATPPTTTEETTHE